MTAKLVEGVEKHLVSREQATGILIILFGAAGESAANRDPAVWDEPDTLKLDPHKPYAFAPSVFVRRLLHLDLLHPGLLV